MEQKYCPICFEIPDLPVSINISKDQKCPFIQKNLVCLRCISSMISHHTLKSKMKCLCNSHFIDISNSRYMCYGDVYHISDDFVEQKLWNSLYYRNKKCNSCHRTFRNIKQLYEHYKYYGNHCAPLPLNTNNIVFLVFIFLLNCFNQLIMRYYFNYCTIFTEEFSKRYCLDDCTNMICNNLQENYKMYAIFFLASYYLTINIFIENVFNLFKKKHKSIILFSQSQMYDIMVLIYFIGIIYLEINKLNDFVLYVSTRFIIELSFQVKICFSSYHYLYK